MTTTTPMTQQQQQKQQRQEDSRITDIPHEVYTTVSRISGDDSSSREVEEATESLLRELENIRARADEDRAYFELELDNTRRLVDRLQLKVKELKAEKSSLENDKKALVETNLVHQHQIEDLHQQLHQSEVDREADKVEFEFKKKELEHAQNQVKQRDIEISEFKDICEQFKETSKAQQMEFHRVAEEAKKDKILRQQQHQEMEQRLVNQRKTMEMLEGRMQQLLISNQKMELQLSKVMVKERIHQWAGSSSVGYSSPQKVPSISSSTVSSATMSSSLSGVSHRPISVVPIPQTKQDFMSIAPPPPPLPRGLSPVSHASGSSKQKIELKNNSISPGNKATASSWGIFSAFYPSTPSPSASSPPTPAFRPLTPPVGEKYNSRDEDENDDYYHSMEESKEDDHISVLSGSEYDDYDDNEEMDIATLRRLAAARIAAIKEDGLASPADTPKTFVSTAMEGEYLDDHAMIPPTIGTRKSSICMGATQ